MAELTPGYTHAAHVMIATRTDRTLFNAVNMNGFVLVSTDDDYWHSTSLAVLNLEFLSHTYSSDAVEIRWIPRISWRVDRPW